MLTLALDTSTAQAALALLRDDTVLAETAVPRTRHDDQLFPVLHRLLADQQLAAAAIELFVVGLGPGSFTGIRAGIAAAKGLALPRRVPLQGISSFDAVALTAQPRLPPDCAAIAVLGDARRDEIYYALYDRDSRCLQPCRLGHIDDLVDHVHDPIWFIGPAIDPFRQPLREILGGFAVVDDRPCLPSAALLGLLGRDQFLTAGGRGQAELTPIYLRPPAYRTTGEQ